MSQLFTVGRVVSDPELRTSAGQTPYAKFSIAERVGFGNHARDQYIRVWAWGPLATQLANAGVRTSALVWVSGSMELEEYTRRDTGQLDKQLKLTLRDWGYLPSGNRKRQGAPPSHSTTGTEDAAGDHAAIIYGDRENLPG